MPESSKDPAQPTNQSKSASGLSAIKGTSRSLHQSALVSSFSPHGFDWFSRFEKVSCNSAGKSASISTWFLRVSKIISRCWILTGQMSSQPLQLVQDQRSSFLIGPVSSSTRGGRFSPPSFFNSLSAFSRRATLVLWIRSFGDSGFPVLAAGQRSSQRPHSVQA